MKFEIRAIFGFFDYICLSRSRFYSYIGQQIKQILIRFYEETPFHHFLDSEADWKFFLQNGKSSCSRVFLGICFIFLPSCQLVYQIPSALYRRKETPIFQTLYFCCSLNFLPFLRKKLGSWAVFFYFRRCDKTSKVFCLKEKEKAGVFWLYCWSQDYSFISNPWDRGFVWNVRACFFLIFWDAFTWSLTVSSLVLFYLDSASSSRFIEKVSTSFWITLEQFWLFCSLFPRFFFKLSIDCIVLGCQLCRV